MRLFICYTFHVFASIFLQSLNYISKLTTLDIFWIYYFYNRLLITKVLFFYHINQKMKHQSKAMTNIIVL